MIDFQHPEDFCRAYPKNFWKNKATLLLNTIKKFDKLKMEAFEGLDELNDQECLSGLKLELHFTYYQIVETLFSMILAFSRKNIDNAQLWKYLVSLSKSQNVKILYKTIQEIAENKATFFDSPVTAGEKLEVPFIHYVIYFGLKPDANDISLKKSIENVKRFLVYCAKDFSDRDEYNAYKHALRFIPQGDSKLEIISHEEQKEIVSFSMKEAVILLKLENGGIAQEIKAFDYERDYNMIMICSSLIHNILMSRWSHYKKEKVSLYFFHDIDMEATSKIKTEIPKLKFSIIPNKDIGVV